MTDHINKKTVVKGEIITENLETIMSNTGGTVVSKRPM